MHNQTWSVTWNAHLLMVHEMKCTQKDGPYIYSSAKDCSDINDLEQLNVLPGPGWHRGTTGSQPSRAGVQYTFKGYPSTSKLQDPSLLKHHMCSTPSRPTWALRNFEIPAVFNMKCVVCRISAACIAVHDKIQVGVRMYALKEVYSARSSRLPRSLCTDQDSKPRLYADSA